MEYTCIFGGGAVRGICYVGALKAMEEIGIKSKTLAGSSVGAVFASLFAVGYTADEIKDIFLEVNYELFKDIHFGFGKSFAISKGGIFLDWLREYIEKKFYGDDYKKGDNPPVKFSDLDKNLVIITTDLKNFRPCVFSKQSTPDYEIAVAARISSTMPGLMNPVEYKDSLLVDGDLQKSWPLWRLSDNLCPEDERILEFRLEGDYEGKGKNPIDFMNTVYSCVTSLATDFIVDTYGNRDKFDYITINTGAVIVVNFNLSLEARRDLMQIGYNTTLNYFQNYLREKKSNLLKHYKEISKHSKQIEKYLKANKIRHTENELGVLYMDLCTSKRYIDIKFVNMIDCFKENFYECLRPAALFGIKSVKNPKLLQAQILRLNIKLEEKIMELESYIYNI